MENLVIGVDIGGTHITACIVDVTTGQIMEGSTVRGDIDPLQDKEQVICSWAETIAACRKQHSRPIDRIGIAMPGPFDYEKGISLITGLFKYECLYGLNVKSLLGAELGIPSNHIKMINDAAAYLAGETKAGAGKDCNHVVGITLGTGLGSAKYVNGVYEDGDLWSFPFRESRAEEYLCSRWFISEYEKRTQQKISGAKELALRVKDDTVAEEMFKMFGYTLAEVLIKRFSHHFPERIVIGGNIAKAALLFLPYCQTTIQQKGFNGTLVPAQLGEDAALIGAACLWS